MIGYVCKYTPIEILKALGAEVQRMDEAAPNYDLAESLMHPNMCSYVKGVLESFARGDYEGIVLTTCCDSVRRLYDTLKERYPDRFIYLLDVPRKVNDFAAGIYARRLREMAVSYQAFREGQKLTEKGGESSQEGQSRPGEGSAKSSTLPQEFPSALLQGVEEDIRRLEKEEENSSRTHAGSIRIALAGGRCMPELLALIRSKGIDVACNLTCTGQSRLPVLRRIKEAAEAASGDLWIKTAEALLNQIPCLRMAKATGREDYLKGFENEIDGIIYHTVKFCDMYSYEYARLKKTSLLPILKLESDMRGGATGQELTRVEAFLETLEKSGKETGMKKDRIYAPGADRTYVAGTPTSGKTYAAGKGDAAASGKTYEAGKGNALASGKTYEAGKGNAPASGKTYVMGVDSGSTSTNVCIMDTSGRIVSSVIIRTGAKAVSSAEKARDMALSQAGLTIDDIKAIAATGYGRISIPYATLNLTEISCHAKGARYYYPEAVTILDIGGQDSKAIRLHPDGSVADFVMNDKCAAGTGRFLEAMARTLEVGIEDLGKLSGEAREDVTISSMCTVFAESEVISLIAQNKEKADIARGVHRAIAGKALGLLNRVGRSGPYMMTGGVARNPGVVKAIEEQLGEKIYICPEPDLVGAAGAALAALESLS